MSPRIRKAIAKLIGDYIQSRQEVTFLRAFFLNSSLTKEKIKLAQEVSNCFLHPEPNENLLAEINLFIERNEEIERERGRLSSLFVERYDGGELKGNLMAIKKTIEKTIEKSSLAFFVPPLDLTKLNQQDDKCFNNTPVVILNQNRKVSADEISDFHSRVSVVKNLANRYINSSKKIPDTHLFFLNSNLREEKNWLATGLLEHVNAVKTEEELISTIDVVINRNKEAEIKLSRLPSFFAKRFSDGGRLRRDLMAMKKLIVKP